LAAGLRFVYEVVVLSDLLGREGMIAPPVPPIAQGRSEHIAGFSTVLPPALAVGEAHRMVAGDRLASFAESLNLIGQAAGRGIVVIIPVTDDVAFGLFAAEVPLLADRARFGEMNKADPVIVWKQIVNGLAVRNYQ
jgi:hypothetical protein